MNKEKIDKELRQVEIKEKEEKNKIEKLKILHELMGCQIPIEATLLSEYTKYKSVFDESELQTLKDKVFTIVAGL